ncbi:MAG: ATP-binding cassette domain-containing protein [Christensenellaceae bacterium]|jgi:ABC-type lipoprotein export system ATPase subunit|nr:ATP-binding cassette domain-containing protein [Christensenellaceae bacterium]
MLSVKNVSKTYRPKKGQAVKALQNVSVDFEDRGLVFVLGKSGSGKSTMLNVIGGLDSFDAGEIIIKGKSSKDFSGSDFDAYRNTFLGFIFQEYNILNDFNLEQNIELALQLQGRKRDDAAISKLLADVDLDGLQRRKVNELSGGQKQRIAIARALIKNPEIILADEPTGALDSATGIAIFDTLKELAKDKLVICVSHDREFAEEYGDRIIVMKDGKVLEDVKKTHAAPKNISENVKNVNDKAVLIKRGKEITDAEVKKIAEQIKAADGEVIITIDKKDSAEVRKTLRFDKDGNSEAFSPVKNTDLKIKEYNGRDLKLIKSHFSLGKAFKMGASATRKHPIRLIMTVLLASVSLVLFGVSATIGGYNRHQSMYDSITQAGNPTMFLTSDYNYKFAQSNGIEESSNGYGNSLHAFTEKEYENLKKLNPNIKMLPIIAQPNPSGYEAFTNNVFQFAKSINDYNAAYYMATKPNGKVVATDENKADFGLTLLAGEFPDTDAEVAITDYQYDMFTIVGYKIVDSNGMEGEKTQPDDITSASVMVGKTLRINGKIYTISGVVNTGYKTSDYKQLRDYATGEAKSDGNGGMADYMLQNAIRVMQQGSLSNALFFTQAGADTVPVESSYSNYYCMNINGSSAHLDESYVVKTLPVDDADTITYRTGESQASASGVVLGASGFSGALNIAGITSYWSSQNVYCPSQYNYQTSSYEYDSLIFFGEEYEFSDYDASTLAAELNEQLQEWFDEIDKVRIYPQSYNGSYNKLPEIKVIGITLDVNKIAELAYTTPSFVNSYGNQNSGAWYLPSEAAFNALTPAEAEKGTINSIAVKLTGDKKTDIAFLKSIIVPNPETAYYAGLKNQFSSIFDEFNGMIDELAKIFMYIAIAFAVFAALMMMNFIASSIVYKRREIGILRALGAKKSDVFSIFFSEALIICMINFVIAIVGTFTAVFFINKGTKAALGMPIQLLSFGFLQIIMVFGLALLVAWLGSLLPVWKIARKKPIDAINNR